MLLADLRKQPCEQALYLSLRAEFAVGLNIGLGFADYYRWYRRSEQNFTVDGELTPAARERFQPTIDVWRSGVEVATPEWLEDTKSHARRHFKIHPRHHAWIDAFVSTATDPPATSVERPGVER